MKYQELKDLPQDQRVIELKNLAKKYKKEDGSPDFKAMSAAIEGSSMVGVIGIYSREVNGMKSGRKKAEPLQQEPIKQETAKQEPVVTKKRGRPVKNNPENRQEQQVKEETIKPSMLTNQPLKYMMSVEGKMFGSEATQRMNGISNALLDKKEYKVMVSVEEV